MSSRKAKKAREIAAFLEVLAACSGKAEPIFTGRDRLSFQQGKDEEDED